MSKLHKQTLVLVNGTETSSVSCEEHLFLTHQKFRWAMECASKGRVGDVIKTAQKVLSTDECEWCEAYKDEAAFRKYLAEEC